MYYRVQKVLGLGILQIRFESWSALAKGKLCMLHALVHGAHAIANARENLNVCSIIHTYTRSDLILDSWSSQDTLLVNS